MVSFNNYFIFPTLGFYCHSEHPGFDCWVGLGLMVEVHRQQGSVVTIVHVCTLVVLKNQFMNNSICFLMLRNNLHPFSFKRKIILIVSGYTKHKFYK